MKAVVGERIRTLRLLLGLTQKELADASGVSQALISQIESGRRMPTEIVVADIMTATGSTEAFFHSAATDVSSDSLRFRKFASTRVTEAQRVEAMIKEAWRVFSILMVRSGYPKPQLPTLERHTLEFSIEDLATEARESLGLDRVSPINHLTRVVERHGIVVVPLALPSLEEDAGTAIGHFGVSCWPSRLDHGLIAVAPGPGDRERFTLAHELGHMVLHSNRSPEDAEEEAHRFAGAILLPRSRMVEAFGGSPATLSDLASLKARWGVSMQAIIMRGSHLGLIDDARKTSLFKQLSARRWRVAEPVEVVREEPALAWRLLRREYGDQPYKPAATELGGLPMVLRGWAPTAA